MLGLALSDEYRDVGFVRDTWFGNDLVTLLIAVPALLVALSLDARGSLRGRLLWLGVLAYGVYNYAFYLFGAAINAFFPIYVIAFLLGAITLATVLLRTDAAALTAQVQRRTPTRVIAGYQVVLAAGVGTSWIVMWAAHVFAGRATPIEPEAFRLVAAMDLVAMVPSLAAGGVLLWRRSVWGVVVSGLAGVLATLYLTVLTVSGVLFVYWGIADPPGEAPIWGSLALATAVTTGFLLSGVGARVSAAR